MVAALENFIDFLKTLRKPSVNFFAAVLLVIFAPDGYKFIAVLPASLFLGWLWDTLIEVTMWSRNEKERQSRLAELSENELQVLDALRQEKSVVFLQKRIEDKVQYDKLRVLERKRIVQCDVHFSRHGKSYHFSIPLLMRDAVEKFFERQVISE